MQQHKREPIEQEFPGHDDDQTGIDLPESDGQVSDDDLQGFSRPDQTGATGGRDHSTEGHDETVPEGGVGGVQDSSDTTSDVARTEP